MISQPVLANFDPAKDITLQDRSKQANTAWELQYQVLDSKPVAFTSKSFYITEQNYAQLEKELCAVLSG